MDCPFESALVFEQYIGGARLRGYSVGFEERQFRLGALVDVIADVIPEFALGFHSGDSIPLTHLRKKLKEAALRVYTTNNYKKRGEFGELILHLLLRDYFSSIPLVSKIYFKDSDNATVHGFDGVHIIDTPGEKSLWLGESKLYTDGSSGVTDLASDVAAHLERDYLRREFSLISTKLPQSVPSIEHWRKMLHEHRRLDEVLDSVSIPAVCTYSSPLFKTHEDNTAAYLDEFRAECNALNAIFLKRHVRTDVNVVLLLVPVPDKDDLVTKLDERLKHMQGI